MASYYYLISSLSSLVLGEKPQLTLTDFMELCSEWVSSSEYEQLDSVSLIPSPESLPKNITVKKWEDWETCLKNQIVKLRAGDLKKDPSNYTQEEKDYFSEIERGVQEAFSAQDPYLKEKILDELRWNALSNLESGHQFDLSTLCIYKLRLMLCEKWLTREQEKGEKNLDDILAKFYTPDSNLTSGEE